MSLKIEDQMIKDQDSKKSRKTVHEMLRDQIKELTIQIGSNPYGSIFFEKRGILYLQLKEYKKSILDLTKSLDLNNSRLKCYQQRSKAYVAIKEYQKAIDDNTESLKLEKIKLGKFNYETFVNRGIVYKIIGDYKNALNDYNKAIEIKPDNDIALINRGNVLHELGKYEIAIKDYSDSIKINESDTSFFNRGSVYNKLNRFNDAIDDFSKAISINGRHYKAFFNRAIIYDKIGELENAIKDYSSVIKLRPLKSFAAFENRGVNNFKLKKYENAVNDFINALKINKNANSCYNLGLSYYYMKNYVKSVESFSNAIKIDNKFCNAYLYRSKSYEELNNEKAISDLLKAIEFNGKYIWYLSESKFFKKIKINCKEISSDVKIFKKYVRAKKLQNRKKIDKIRKDKNCREEFFKTLRLTDCVNEMKNKNKELSYSKLVKNEEDQKFLEKFKKFGAFRSEQMRIIRMRKINMLKDCNSFLCRNHQRELVLKRNDEKMLKKKEIITERRNSEYNVFSCMFGGLKEIYEKKKKNTYYQNCKQQISVYYNKRLKSFKNDQKKISKEKLIEFVTTKKWEHIIKWVKFNQIENLNEKLTDGNCLLHYASMYGNIKLCLVLLQNNASMKIKNKNKKFPMSNDICCKFGGMKTRLLEMFHFFKKYSEYKYEGAFKNGKFSGFGKLYKKIGSRYGSISNIVASFSLVEIPKYFLEFEGEFEDGEKNGIGKLYYRNGKVKFHGKFKMGSFHGQGIEYLENGEIKMKGLWENGKIKSSLPEIVAKEIDLTPIIKKVDYTNDYLGGGSYCEVFKIKWNEKICVAKVFHKQLIEEIILKSEVDILTTLNTPGHKNVIKLFGWSPFSFRIVGYVTEIAEKGPISRMIQNKNMDWKLKLKILSGTIDGMVYVHNVHNIIHYDLKWSNVLLNKWNEVKLIDFGLSKPIESFKQSLRHSRLVEFFF